MGYTHNSSNRETTGQFKSTLTTVRIGRPQDSSNLHSQQFEPGDHRTVPIYTHNSSNLETTGQFQSTLTTVRIWTVPIYTHNSTNRETTGQFQSTLTTVRIGRPQNSSNLQSQQFESGDHHRTVPI